jgi:hypothetical protein
MSLLHSTSISRRSRRPFHLPLHRFAVASLLALGAGGLLPSLAHADDGSFGPPPAPPPRPVNEQRPLSMRDLGAVSSIGVAGEAGLSQVDSLGGGSTTVDMGLLTLDGELALGRHVKVFASFPMTAGKGDSTEQDFTGHGNLTLGVQAQTGSDAFRAGVGATYSRWGEDSSAFASVLRFDAPAYVNLGKVLQGFAGVAAARPDAFVQGQLRFTTVVLDDDFEKELDDPRVGELTIGGGKRLSGGPTVLGELGLMRNLSGATQYEYLAGLGLRGRMADDSGGTWGLKASFMHAEHVTSFGLGFELRADLPVVSGQ